MIKNVTIDRDVSIKTNFKYNITENEVIGYLKNPKIILKSSTSNKSTSPESGFLILPNNFCEMLQTTCSIMISFAVEEKPGGISVLPTSSRFNCQIYAGQQSIVDKKYKLSFGTILPEDPADAFGLLVGSLDLVDIKNLRIEYTNFKVGQFDSISTTVQFDGIVGVDRLVIEEIQ